MHRRFHTIEHRYLAFIEQVLRRSVRARQPNSVYEPARYLLDAGGKRMRPMLVMLSCAAAGGDVRKSVYAAAALEILHTFTLVHDDIMDNALSRRGRATVHTRWNTNVAILVGDEFLALAYRSLFRTEHKNIKRIAELFTEGVVEVCEGQGYDKEYESRNDVSFDEYRMMITKKTARLLAVGCEIGGILGGANERRCRALRKFGEHIGRAFQIQDDLLDIISDEKTFGKIIGGDLREGKKTFLLLTALECTTGQDHALISRVVNEKGVPEILVPAIKEIYERCGVIEKTRSAIEKECTLGIRYLKTLPAIAEREMLRRYALQLAGRTF
ncbi:MAG: polyprenyl synthetase family protein [Bacteroidota bacterium]